MGEHLSPSEGLDKDSFWQNIAQRQFSRPVRSVVSAIESKKQPLIAGPFGSGKTRLLLPLLSAELADRGHQVTIVDGAGILGHQSFTEIGPQATILIDEANAVPLDNQASVEALAIQIGAGNLIVPVFAFELDKMPQTHQESLPCSEFLANHSRKPQNLITLEQLIITDEEALNLISAKCKNLNIEELNRLLKLLPKNPRFLDNFFLGYYQSVEEAIKRFLAEGQDNLRIKQIIGEQGMARLFDELPFYISK